LIFLFAPPNALRQILNLNQSISTKQNSGRAAGSIIGGVICIIKIHSQGKKSRRRGAHIIWCNLLLQDSERKK